MLMPQARSQAIEAQLASTVAELCNLRVRQQHLESRNQLLEKCSSLTSGQNSDQVSELRFSSVRDGLTGLACLAHCFPCNLCLLQDGPYEKLYIAHETDASEHGPSVTISVQGGRRQMTVQEISLMPVAEFASLWTVRCGINWPAVKHAILCMLQYVVPWLGLRSLVSKSELACLPVGCITTKVQNCIVQQSMH